MSGVCRVKVRYDSGKLDSKLTRSGKFTCM